MKTLSYFNLGKGDIEIVDLNARENISSLSSKLDSIPQDLDTHLLEIDNSLSTKVSMSYSASTKTITFKR